jgi:hypothetical protein
VVGAGLCVVVGVHNSCVCVSVSSSPLGCDRISLDTNVQNEPLVANILGASLWWQRHWSVVEMSYAEQYEHIDFR